MPRPNPPGLHRERTRHGKIAYYVRPEKGKRTRIRGEYGTPEFKAAYDAAIRGEPMPAGKADFPVQSLGWLIARYRESTAWTELSIATRRQRENIFRHALKAAGREPYTRITKAAMVAARDRRKGNAGRHFLQAMHGLFEWAIEAQHAETDPTAGIKRPRPRTEGFKIWPQEWHDKFKARWPLGTRPRLVYAVAYSTGLRRGDLVVVGRPHVKKNRGSIRTEKGGRIIVAHFPFDADAQAAVVAGPTGGLTFIASESGQPITKETLGNFMREWCDAAGVPGSLHGLRKAKATYVAEHGGTEAELDSMFGWKRGSGTSAIYTQTADAERLAANAIARLEQDANVYSRTSQSGAGTGRKKKARSNG